MTSHNSSGSVSKQLTRRRLLQQSAAVGGLSAAAVALGVRPERGLAQQSSFTRNASITEWGFGTEETNVMAFSRVDAFKQAFPNIQLEVVPQFDDQKLLTGFTSKQLPDLLWMDRAKLTSWAARGVLSPLDDLIAKDQVDTSAFYPAALDEVTFDGKIYGIPQFMDVSGLYVNNDAVSEVGADPATIDTANWQSLSDLGAKLVKKNGDQIDRWGFDHKMQAGSIWMWGAGNGGTFLDDDGNPTFDNDKVAEALDWGVKAYDAQGGFKGYEAVATTWQGDEQFARGQVGMTIYESWMLGIVARVSPQLNFKVLPVKQNGGEADVSTTGGRAWCIPNGAKDPEAAWEFIKFMNSIDTWRIGATAVKAAQDAKGAPYIPSLTAHKAADQMQIDEFYTSIAPQFDDAVKLWPQILAQSTIRPTAKSPAGAELNDIIQQDGVLPALRGEKSAKDALSTANGNAKDAIDSL